jgi:hypothetical protein
VSFSHRCIVQRRRRHLTGGAASVQLTERTIRVSNGVSADHPIGSGLAKMNRCAGDKSDGIARTRRPKPLTTRL